MNNRCKVKLFSVSYSIDNNIPNLLKTHSDNLRVGWWLICSSIGGGIGGFSDFF